MTAALDLAGGRRSSGDGPSFWWHPSFQEPDAEACYGGPLGPAGERPAAAHLSDEETRNSAARMHYAAYRLDRDRLSDEARHWRERYFACRNRIVVGHRRLVGRAVNRWVADPGRREDWEGDLYLVLIRAAAGYNPWAGLRFSTYAFPCLLRALGRLSRQHADDRPARAVPLELLPGGEPRAPAGDHRLSECLSQIEEYLREGTRLLSRREKVVLRRRFGQGEGDRAECQTLAEIGRDLRVCKERVRQIEADALGKLRAAILRPRAGAFADRDLQPAGRRERRCKGFGPG
jgi:RNA polymerase sigma factor (sigma-70 family)